MRVAVVGATGAVGQQMLSILEERKFPVSHLRVFASARSSEKKILFADRDWSCEILKSGCFEKTEQVFFDASDAVSKEWVPQALAAGAWVVDHSAAFRMDSQVPLAVPEINGDEIDQLVAQGKQRLVSGPNCSTVQITMALKPILDCFGLKRVLISTYQSVSGAGAAAMQELIFQTHRVLHGEPAKPSVFPHPIAFNCIPQIGSIQSDGYTSEEQKIMEEVRKILNLSHLKISATAIRVPTLNCHAASVQVECEREPELKKVREALSKMPGVLLLDDSKQGEYPMNLSFVGKDLVGVGRIRKDPALDHGLSFWVVADNLRKGAALNAVQIGERICLKNTRQ